jgi:hypothetical protein
MNTLKYMSDCLKSAHLRKMNFTSFHSKIKLIKTVISHIHYYLNEKTSSKFENYFSCNLKRNKIDFIKDLIKKYDYMVSLSKPFDKALEFATKLFFFFSECKEFDDLTKQFYGVEMFEKFDNYIINILGKKEEDKSYLLPIFTERSSFIIYESLLSLKSSLIVCSALITDTSEMHLIISKLIYNLFDDLVDFSVGRKNLESKLNICLSKDKLFSVDSDKFIEKDYLIEVNKIVLNYLYGLKGFDHVEDSFLAKYKPQHIASEILTIYVQIAEKLHKYQLSFLIYLILLLNPCNHRKRGFFWYRINLVYYRYLKNNKRSCLELVKHALNDKYIKTGYLVKIKKYHQTFNSTKSSNKEKEALKIDSFTPKSDFFSEITIKVQKIVM